jgi:hypothetical protein
MPGNVFFRFFIESFLAILGFFHVNEWKLAWVLKAIYDLSYFIQKQLDKFFYRMELPFWYY